MCGIAGFWQKDGVNGLGIAMRMATEIKHRGPDDSGAWVDESEGLAFAHRRLSIIDLSSAGHQPMQSPCGRYVLTYNGEIYNHLEIRKELQSEGGAVRWNGHSDSETLLIALRHWGVRRALEKLNGMFVFALWDKNEKTLYLARDRMGEKPLYYGRCGDVFLFGSELKALQAHPKWDGTVDRNALSLFMRHNYVPTPWSIFKGIRKLTPASFVVIRDHGEFVSSPHKYWDLEEVARRGVQAAEGDENELIGSLDCLLRDSIAMRMASDVPLGAFLSGGYDSTAVVALMQAQSSRPIRTFSIGFHEAAHNEAHYAKEVAEHLGTDHTELYVRPEEALATIPELPRIWDEPFADSSQIPTFLVSQLARKHVTVSLSGDGGDELFCGYTRYAIGHSIWRKIRALPTPIRSVVSAIAKDAPGHFLDSVLRLLPPRMRPPSLEDRLPKLAEVLRHQDVDEFYRSLVSHWKNPDDVVIDGREPPTHMCNFEALSDLKDPRERMMYLDEVMYLPDDILTKVDRASMAVSLESRVPLLDHRLVEFAWNVPTRMKYRNGQGKWILRQVLYRYVPPKLVDRPKMGFGVPIESWLSGPLKDWASELLDSSRMREEGFFNPEPIQKMWNEHLQGRRRWHYPLWNVLMFQAWLRYRP